MEVVLEPVEIPPPTDHVEFIREVVKPKPQPVPVKPKIVPKVINRPKPQYTAPNATGQGESRSVSRLVVGTSGFPHPGYPASAMMMHLEGTVVVTIQFDGNGQAQSVDVANSSGVGILDSNTRTFIRENWHNADFAGKLVTVPVEYTLSQ
jgi:TonB family protein